jgi:hypothetical protein
MTIVSADVLSTHLKPLCSRDNHVMKYESRGSWSNAENQASYHCGFEGCSVRYSSTDGYYMLIGMPNHANPLDEPGVNTAKCPRDTTTGCIAERVSMKNHREKRSLAELMSFIFNAAASTEKISRTGLGLKKS